MYQMISLSNKLINLAGQYKVLAKLHHEQYVHFASLFYITIHCYLLIYFILEHCTNVILSIFACFTFSRNNLSESESEEKKDASRDLFSGAQKNARKSRKLFLNQISHGARRGSGGGHVGPTPH